MAARGLTNCRLALLLLLAPGVTGIAAVAGPALHGPPSAPHGANLAQMHLTLSRTQPYRFQLHYRGPTMAFRGLLCYGFAGYNETCMDPKLRWLTPATTIELYAPGGVPRDLLDGYTLEVRYPAYSDRVFRYHLGDGH